MFFQSWSDFIDMGGYGFFVWLAFGLTFLSFAVLAFWERHRKIQLIQQCHHQQMREQRLQQRQS